MRALLSSLAITACLLLTATPSFGNEPWESWDQHSVDEQWHAAVTSMSEFYVKDDVRMTGLIQFICSIYWDKIAILVVVPVRRLPKSGDTFPHVIVDFSLLLNGQSVLRDATHGEITENKIVMVNDNTDDAFSLDDSILDAIIRYSNLPNAALKVEVHNSLKTFSNPPIILNFNLKGAAKAIRTSYRKCGIQ